ncbi:MAG: hypothetical protein JRM74_00500 [Nitrososphaerota archaeon]|nr:hypothetical protein [Nitrososphaerota archaeon]MDG6981920.1 hypothetical protein [Nitrososphaerota archaeon]
MWLFRHVDRGRRLTIHAEAASQGTRSTFVSLPTAETPAREEGPTKRAFAYVFRMMDLSTKMYVALRLQPEV